MRLFSVTVTRNEQHRYLTHMLGNLDGQVDASFIYDDASTDLTPWICERLGCVVVRRPDDRPSFIENERLFRTEAWVEFEQACRPAAGDWVLVLDADELPVAPLRLGGFMRSLAAAATEAGQVGVDVPIPEVWEVFPELMVRTDGWWGRLSAPRFFAYRPEGFMPQLGCVPDYVQAPYFPNDEFGPHGLSLLHLGYVRAEDRAAKYERYAGGMGNHNPAHVRSILNPPDLCRWAGPQPRWPVEG